MPRPRSLRVGEHTTARIWEFAGRDLRALQEALLTEGMQKAGKDDLASGLLWVAARLPPPVVKAMIETYLKAEAADFLAGQGTRSGDPG
jgi:hypothetical protein